MKDDARQRELDALADTLADILGPQARQVVVTLDRTIADAEAQLAALGVELDGPEYAALADPERGRAYVAALDSDLFRPRDYRAALEEDEAGTRALADAKVGLAQSRELARRLYDEAVTIYASGRPAAPEAMSRLMLDFYRLAFVSHLTVVPDVQRESVSRKAARGGKKKKNAEGEVRRFVRFVVEDLGAQSWGDVEGWLQHFCDQERQGEGFEEACDLFERQRAPMPVLPLDIIYSEEGAKRLAFKRRSGAEGSAAWHTLRNHAREVLAR